MDLTPRDIQQKQFNDAFRGYSHEEVDAFLDEVAEAFSRIYRENQNTQLRLRETDKELALAKQTEGMLKRTLLTAQQTVDETIAEARARAQEIEKVANSKAAEIMAEAQARIMEMRATLEGLKRYERDYRDRLRAFMENQLEVLSRPVEQPAEGAVPPPAPQPEWPAAVQEVHSAAEADLRPAPLPPRRQPDAAPATTPETSPATPEPEPSLAMTPEPAQESVTHEPPPAIQTQDLVAPSAPPAIASRSEEEVPVQGETQQASISAPTAAAPIREVEPALAMPLSGGTEAESSPGPVAVTTEHSSDSAEVGSSIEQGVDSSRRPPQAEPALGADGVNGEAGRRPDGEAGRRTDKSSKENADEKSISELFWGED